MGYMLDCVVDLVEERVDLGGSQFLNQFLNVGTLRMLYNRMWKPWNSEVHVHLVQHCLLVT